MKSEKGEKSEGGKEGVINRAPTGLVLLGLVAALPQVLVEGVLRPVVDAMPGGVGALRALSSEWGVGLLVRAADETAQAALPATGMALAVALAAVLLYWLSLLVGRFALSEGTEEAGTGMSEDVGMDCILPGAEQAGRWLDPVAWAGWILRARRSGTE